MTNAEIIAAAFAPALNPHVYVVRLRVRDAAETVRCRVREGRDVTEACDEYRAAIAGNPCHGMTHEAYAAKLAA